MVDWASTRAFFSAPWSGRVEGPAPIAERVTGFLAELAGIRPELSGWRASDGSALPPLEAVDDWRAVVVDGGHPMPGMGYKVTIRAPWPTGGAARVDLHLGGQQRAPGRQVNRVVLAPEGFVPTWSPIARPVLRALVRWFQPDYASFVPDVANRPQFKIPYQGWPVIGAETWLSTAAANLPAVVDGAEVEPWGDGAFLSIPSAAAITADSREILLVRAALERDGVIGKVPAPQAVPPRPGA